MEMEEFQPATKLNRAQRKLAERSKGIKNKSKLEESKPQGAGPSNGFLAVATDPSMKRFVESFMEDILSPHDLVRLINRTIGFSKEHPEYFESFTKVLNETINDIGMTPGKIVCYGLGPFRNSMTSRYQVAFLLELKEKMDLPVEIYDPYFSPNEKEVLSKEFDVTVLEENEEGKRSICLEGKSPTTIFYMPHCPHQLVNNLLYTNWNALNLPHIILICNSFAVVKDNPMDISQQNLVYTDRAMPILREYGLLNTFPYYQVFNDLAIHVFPTELVQSRKYETEFWVKGEEPAYKFPGYVTAAEVKNLSIFKKKSQE